MRIKSVKRFWIQKLFISLIAMDSCIVHSAMLKRDRRSLSLSLLTLLMILLLDLSDSPRLSLPVRENKPNHAMVEENLSVYFLLEEKALLTQWKISRAGNMQFAATFILSWGGQLWHSRGGWRGNIRGGWWTGICSPCPSQRWSGAPSLNRPGSDAWTKIEMMF